MSKIVCDVCGTSYPDTATQCPICGCVRSADVEAVVTNPEGSEPISGNSYTYVKGGRFSKSNVKKRNSGKPVATASVQSSAKPVSQAKSEHAAPKQKSNLGLIIVIIVLLLAIVAVLAYIAIRFVVPNFVDSSTEGTSEYDPALIGDPDTITDPEDVEVPCAGLSLTDAEVFLLAADESYVLTVILTPEDTTDPVTYASDDETIATVDADGVITAVAAGQTIITVTCGDETAQCTVICDFATEEPGEELVLDAEEHTFTAKGETWMCYTGTIAVEDITWTSDDEAVATVSDGVVTAVGAGTTNIYAEYNDQKVSCAILCSDTVDTTEATEPTEPTENGNTGTEPSTTPNENYRFNTSDKNEAMIRVGQKFDLKLLDENGKPLTGVKFTTSNSKVCTVSESGRIKGIAYGNITITAEYNGAVYKCKIYVR